jgi:hypothetical protein
LSIHLNITDTGKTSFKLSFKFREKRMKNNIAAVTVKIEEKLELAETNNLPLSRYMNLAAEDSVDVRYHLASNANIPKVVLEILAEDENVFVSHRAQSTLSRIKNGSVLPYGTVSAVGNLISA